MPNSHDLVNYCANVLYHVKISTMQYMYSCNHITYLYQLWFTMSLDTHLSIFTLADNWQTVEIEKNKSQQSAFSYMQRKNNKTQFWQTACTLKNEILVFV